MVAKSERLCVIIPVCDQVDVIRTVLAKWDEELERLGADYEIRPWNNGSRDASLAVMKAFAVTHPRISVRTKERTGRGNTIITGCRDAAHDGFDWIFQVGADDDMGPAHFDELWSRRDDYDLLVGTRDGRRQSFPSRMVSLISRICVRLFYGRGVWDVNTPYRLMRVSAFAKYFDAMSLNTVTPNVIISGVAAREGMRFYETGIPPRMWGPAAASIIWWKLAKAAVRSFAQTISFSKVRPE